MTTYNVHVDWPALHEAFKKLDVARRSHGCAIGYDGISDALGGTYFGGHYESAGLVGLARLVVAEARIRDDAWRLVHSTRGGLVEVRAACATVLALDEVNRLLAGTGLETRAGRSIICGTDGVHVAVSGLCWLVGMQRDDRLVPLVAVKAFVETGDLDALRVALTGSDVDQAIYANL